MPLRPHFMQKQSVRVQSELGCLRDSDDGIMINPDKARGPDFSGPPQCLVSFAALENVHTVLEFVRHRCKDFQLLSQLVGGVCPADFADYVRS